MKVAFIGTHGVGKTTLCYDVAGLLKKRDVNVDIVKEVARLSPLPVNRQTSLDAQTWILTTQVAEEIRAAAHSPVVICDRSVLDNYAYMAKACGRQKPVERFVDFWMKTYDLLFKVPSLGTGASADGFRDTDEFFMRAIDELVDRLLAEKKIPHERLPGGERERWAALAVEEILRAPALARLF
ncbi:MAG TPA: AAA family ATPase [Vicinamibacteria bacterium]|jgi:nicotinamide riboside kinase|nr:AAA family ATPase [Vicinamibacteria bacterium]